MKHIKGVLLDLDGTLYLGNSVFPFTLEFLKTLEANNIKHLFLTNNSSKSTESYIKKFASMGIFAEKDDILISTHAAADYLMRNFPEKRVFAMGNPDFKRELAQMGIVLDEEAPEVLLAGFDTTLEYERLSRFTNLVAEGLPYIATHPDAVCPAEKGFLPDLGSIIELIFTCCHRYPDVVCGKPNEQILVAAENRLGIKRENLLMVGDRLTTDIAIGACGVGTALVLSGEAKPQDVPTAPVQPTYIFPSVKELGEALAKYAVFS